MVTNSADNGHVMRVLPSFSGWRTHSDCEVCVGESTGLFALGGFVEASGRFWALVVKRLLPKGAVKLEYMKNDKQDTEISSRYRGKGKRPWWSGSGANTSVGASRKFGLNSGARRLRTSPSLTGERRNGLPYRALGPQACELDRRAVPVR